MDYGSKQVIQAMMPDGGTEELLVTQVGPNHYRLEESSLWGEFKYHDVIETEKHGNENGVRVLRVASSSALKALSWILPESAFESSALKGVLEKVMACEGNWERTFNGMLTIHVPPLAEQSFLDEMQLFLSGQRKKAGS